MNFTILRFCFIKWHFRSMKDKSQNEKKNTDNPHIREVTSDIYKELPYKSVREKINNSTEN